MIRIALHNFKSQINGSPNTLEKLRSHPMMCIPVKSSFWIKRKLKDYYSWDGNMRYISKSGVISTGKIPQLIKIVTEEFGDNVRIADFRNSEEFKPTFKRDFGDFKLRLYQYKTVKKALNNKLPGGISFPNGIINAATNAGKTIISAGLHLSIGKKTLFLINSKDLLEQALEEIPKLLPGKVGFLVSKSIQWNDFMIVMVPTLKNRLNNYRAFEIKDKLQEYPVKIVDECDLSTSETYKICLTHLQHCYVNIGMSGSVFVNEDRNKNEQVRCNFGDELVKITNKQLIDAGYSSKVHINILYGNKSIEENFRRYSDQYRHGIERNVQRNSKIIRRLRLQIKRDRLPALAIARTHYHVEKLYNMAKQHLGESIRIEWVHHSRKNRTAIINKFKRGEIDLLIGSYILKRGQNFPLMQYIINASGGKGAQIILQILGRATRKHKSKVYTLLEDFYDEWSFLRKHSKRRIKTYKNEQLVVKEPYKKCKKGSR